MPGLLLWRCCWQSAMISMMPLFFLSFKLFTYFFESSQFQLSIAVWNELESIRLCYSNNLKFFMAYNHRFIFCMNMWVNCSMLSSLWDPGWRHSPCGYMASFMAQGKRKWPVTHWLQKACLGIDTFLLLTCVCPKHVTWPSMMVTRSGVGELCRGVKQSIMVWVRLNWGTSLWSHLQSIIRILISFFLVISKNFTLQKQYEIKN